MVKKLFFSYSASPYKLLITNICYFVYRYQSSIYMLSPL
ncbi:hypothetical protein M097_1339 [Phocaeicola vulgatus str. 3775 SL(B) 10 (iv)]|uniref:Uncharacterized protein n=1 Tax=Phocaeicola vulgatus str. 3775 SL(B) 10 (iv) TaxID=1339350 RepID=A0A078RAU4_PHOVU|nr:hypothetical protein M098_0580 [Phocaeicola vulgatus str. 3775 SR(B) 19]KDS32460.1 hypothetical protein M097_1339 [Phocaeicola vulgatus str. 3775 SL(B) 10 (iv)]